MKLSKENEITAKKNVFLFARTEGVIKSIAIKALDHLKSNKLALLSEFEITFLYDAFYALINKYQPIQDDFLKAYNVIEQSWAMRAKLNGAKLSKDHNNKTLH